MVHILKRPAALTGQVLTLALLFTLTLLQPTAIATSSIPPVWSIVADDFESGTLDAWKQVSPGSLSLLPGSGPDGSTALSVIVSQNVGYLYEPDTAHEKGGLSHLLVQSQWC